MATRRGFLKYLVAAGAGIGAYAAYSGDVGVPKTVTNLSDVGGPPVTDTEIKTVSTDQTTPAYIRSITFYESGAAEVLFERDHEIDGFGVTHAALNSPEDHFTNWSTPRFEGPKTIDLRSPITNNGPYPNNQFVLGANYDAQNEVYLGDSTAEFTAPPEWFREANSG